MFKIIPVVFSMVWNVVDQRFENLGPFYILIWRNKIGSLKLTLSTFFLLIEIVQFVSILVINIKFLRKVAKIFIFVIDSVLNLFKNF